MHLEDHWMGEKKFRKTLSTVEGLIYLVYFACMWLTSVIKSSHQLAFGEGSFEKYGQWEWGQIWRWGRFSIFPSVPSHPKLQISRWGMPYWGLYCPLRLRIGLFFNWFGVVFGSNYIEHVDLSRDCLVFSKWEIASTTWSTVRICIASLAFWEWVQSAVTELFGHQKWCLIA